MSCDNGEMQGSGTLDTRMDADLPGHVDHALADYFQRRRLQIGEIGADFGTALDALADFVMQGGKRIRPTFAWWGWRGAGGTAGGPAAEAVIRAVSALELLQACALVHDDLMDASAVRRGSPTVHVAFAAQHRAGGLLGEPTRFGMAAAVLIGDIALAWAEDMFLGSGVPAAAVARAVSPWQAMRTEMLAGQYIDMLTQARGDESEAAALRVDRYKTASYTVERPLHIGAALAGARPDLIDAYRAFGADLGRGVPTAGRPARRVRRPGGDRQTGR